MVDLVHAERMPTPSGCELVTRKRPFGNPFSRTHITNYEDVARWSSPTTAQGALQTLTSGQCRSNTM